MPTLKENFVTFDYDVLWTDYSDSACELVPLSEREVSILLSCLRVAKWASRWFVGDLLLRQLGRFTDLETARTFIENLERKLLMTGCLEDLTSVLRQIRDAVQAQAACCASGTNGTRLVQVGEEFYYGTQQPLDKPDTFGPGEEFATQEEFNTHLCNGANLLVDGLILSLNEFSVLTLASAIAGAVVVSVFVANPPIGLFIAIGVLAGSYTFLQAAANYINDNRTEWVCALYNAESYADFLVELDALVSGLTIELELGFFDVELTNFFRSLIDTDTFNKTYTNQGLPPVIGAVDCDACGDVCTLILQQGNDLGSNQYQSVDAGAGAYQLLIDFYIGGSRCEKTITISPSNTPTQWGATVVYRLYDASLNEIYASNTLPPQTSNVSQIYIVQDASSAPTTYTLTIS